MKVSGKKIISIAAIALITATIVTGDVFAGKYRSIISGFFGCTEQIDGDKTTIDEGAKTGDQVVRKIANEGVVLLRNEKNKIGRQTLPLPATTKKINIFGWYATDSGFLLAGNGSGRSYVHKDNKVTLLGAFKEAGFEYNQEIIDIYEKHCKSPKDWGETQEWANRYHTKLKEPVTDVAFPNDVRERAKSFSDTALIVLSRYSGEYIERISNKQEKEGLPTDETRNFSQISTEEESLIKMCTANFDNVIVVFNTGSIMQMDFLEDLAFGNIGAALNVGYMGQSGATAIPKILTGEVNPSGRLADTILYNPTKDEITRINCKNGDTDIVYAEDIYVGYKWYETASAEGYLNYDDVVQYPFGFGLDYSDFSWKISSFEVKNLDSNSKYVTDPSNKLASDSKISLSVEVTNNSDIPGKDVVELYYHAPYYNGGIEKSEINLLDFAKTPTLKKGESYTVQFEFTPYEMASYDCYDKNNNGSARWELDAGDYNLFLRTDSHTNKEMEGNNLTMHVEDIISYRKDQTTNARVKNRFTGETAYGGLGLDGKGLKAQDGEDWTYLSRSDIANTIPKVRSKTASNASIKQYLGYKSDAYDYYDTMPTMNQENNLRLVTKEDGSFVSKDEFSNGGSNITLKYNDELINELIENYDTTDKWDLLLNQLSENDLRALVEGSGYQTQPIASIGKPKYLEYDGPSGFNRTNMSPNVPGSKFTALPAENLMAQTWNKELLYQAGQIVGIDGNNFGINGIYAPTVNLHREMMNERNYECYSEDPIISGYMAAYFIKGAASNNVYCYLKHLALYDASTYVYFRVWCTEQNFRENYLKPFEIAIKKGGANGLMASFNKVGANWAGSNDAMINGVIRGEFGFKGTVITDWSDGSISEMDIHSGLRGGLNTQLNPNYPTTGSYGKVDFSSPVEVNLARESAKSIIYTSCSTYYAAKHKTSSDDFSVVITGPKAQVMGFEWWILVLAIAEIIIFAALGFWIFVLFRKPKKQPVAIDDNISSLSKEEKDIKIQTINNELNALYSRIDSLKQELKRLKK